LEESIALRELLVLLLINFAVIVAAALVAWAASLRLRDASIADVLWGLGFVLIAGTSLGLAGATTERVKLIVAMVAIWGMRLSLHLLRRKWGEPEDKRYAAMRERDGARFGGRSLFSVFTLQAALIWFIALPVQLAVWRDDQSMWTWLDGAGAAIWLIGFYFEAVGDWQLAQFKSKASNRSRVMDQGLWRYTRHPNYFGDFCVWWGIYLIAANGGAAATVASPALMSLLLLRVSGVTLLERTIVDRRPDYAEYQRRVNAFFPGRRRR
jgi:steroid 5-alpha reductase family enzyme